MIPGIRGADLLSQHCNSFGHASDSRSATALHAFLRLHHFAILQSVEEDSLQTSLFCIRSSEFRLEEMVLE